MLRLQSEVATRAPRPLTTRCNYLLRCFSHQMPPPSAATSAPATNAATVTDGPKALHEQLAKTGLPPMRSRRRQKAHGIRFGSTWPGRGHCSAGEIIKRWIDTATRAAAGRYRRPRKVTRSVGCNPKCSCGLDYRRYHHSIHPACGRKGRPGKLRQNPAAPGARRATAIHYT